MTPTIHFVRHAQGYHNLGGGNYLMHDPLLTPFGMEQCTVLSKTFPYISDVDLLVVSPLKRTIYTALYSFPSKTHLGLIAVPELQETSDLPCDTGSDKEVLVQEFDGKKIDFQLVTEGWNTKKGRWAPSAPAIEERCRVARNWLRERKENNIVVVTHGGVLHYLTEDWTGHDKFEGTGWANTEYRSYTFTPNSGDAASLVETEESQIRRSGTEKPLGEAEQRNLKETATTNWHTNGYMKREEHASKGDTAAIPAKV